MRLFLQKLHELLSYLASLGVPNNHANLGRGDAAVQLAPKGLETLKKVISFGDKGEVVLLGLAGFLEIVQKVN